MRRNVGVLLAALAVIITLIALGAAGSVELDRPTETESSPNRSSYNEGPTGVRVFFQLLEESGTPVSRWRENYESLSVKEPQSTLIAVGPYPGAYGVSETEYQALRAWIAKGGRLLVISRTPRFQFSDSVIHSETIGKNLPWDAPADASEDFVYDKSDELISQPTDLTLDLQGLAISRFASRMKFFADVSEITDGTDAPPPPAALPTPSAEPAENEPSENDEAETPDPSPPTASPEVSPTNTPSGAEPDGATEPTEEEESEEYLDPLQAPITHLGDAGGAVLADFTYGKGRVVLLSDPFVIANNGLSRGGNLRLAMNLIRSLGGEKRGFLFDEYHHGYRATGNSLVNYFRGTGAGWMALQGLVLAGLLLATYGRRFTRPMPLPQNDRRSPLEFVGSMANLQLAAEARELALENIYPRFKTRLLQRLGLSSRASIEEIVETTRRRGLAITPDELRNLLRTGEAALRGTPSPERLDDARLIETVAAIRRISARL
jgi:hypothetical protein